ncbi:MAG: dTMP kinase [Spirochaetota bacterium]|nr:dTMP kinase [Spirochaetota bacterium]
MHTDSFFLVIEGLDGSGKTEIARRLAQVLQITFKDKVKLTFEPHDPSCAGLFIRQVLMKKIRKFSPRTLALAFAANRLDHCDREITPFLTQGKKGIIVCDRYYLSSLVYQTTQDIPTEEVMSFNSQAKKPDLTIFLDASDRVCFERMKRRAQDKELFEKNLRETRRRYQGAIAFLRERGERIVEVNADSSILEVLRSIIGVLGIYGPDWLVVQPILSIDLLPKVFSLDGERDLKIAHVALQFRHHWEQGPILNENEFQESLEALHQEIRDEVLEMPFNDLGSLFLDHITQSGYEVGEKLAWSDLDAFEVEYAMPINIKQRGIALLIGEAVLLQTELEKSLL